MSLQPSKKKKNKTNKSRAIAEFFGGTDRLGMPRGSDYTVHVNAIGFPDRYRCYLRYSEVGVNFGGSAFPAAQVYRSSLFDPNLTGVGHQPQYFDQLATVYGRYCVLGMRVTVEANNNSSTAPVVGVIAFADLDISAQSVESLNEWKYSKKFNLGTSSGLSAKTIVTPFVESAKMQGQPSVETDPNIYSSVLTTPTDPWYIIIKFAADDLLTTTNVYCSITVEFDCIFKEVTTPGESLTRELPSQALARLNKIKSKSLGISSTGTK